MSFTAGCGGPVDRAVADGMIGQLREFGTSLVDATDLTTGGDVETVVGRALRGRRTAVLLASRSGGRYTRSGRLVDVDARPETVTRSCHTTLRRLGTDYLDLYLLDRADPRVPVEESVQAMAALVAAGKVRHLGVAHVGVGQLRRAHAVHPLALVAAEYSLLGRCAETELLPAARALGIGFAAYRPLGAGLLTGRLDSPDQLAPDAYQHADPRFRPDNFARTRRMVGAAQRVATRRHVGVSRLALAWLLAQGPDVLPVAGTRDPTHLEMNLAAAAVRLDAAERARLATVSDPRDAVCPQPVGTDCRCRPDSADAGPDSADAGSDTRDAGPDSQDRAGD
ncbi:aldo/keto reductase [Solwaraspora sp. WMMA2056]|uniref:aldo/keto reductase n=1 Tax=Solwaraspora sp. WMMA2056 TaxID=3015161 RepID=UPI00259B6C6D|nr:aldo/keto reductase [Solwaraspora sp. WMMA2056]WJK38256.1 aldo/keto reductase [Solwaraspora sp. WMMA2056]